VGRGGQPDTQRTLHRHVYVVCTCTLSSATTSHSSSGGGTPPPTTSPSLS
jgi:hypothetical protein